MYSCVPQVTTQLLFIQWLDNFQAHARMALPPAAPWRLDLDSFRRKDFVVCTKRHEGLLAALFGSTEGLDSLDNTLDS